jgi:hypothetical protein
VPRRRRGREGIGIEKRKWVEEGDGWRKEMGGGSRWVEEADG